MERKVTTAYVAIVHQRGACAAVEEDQYVISREGFVYYLKLGQRLEGVGLCVASQVYADHQYELISKYNNTTDVDSTAMAFMFCYVEDPYFKKPSSEELAKRTNEFCAPPIPTK